MVDFFWRCVLGKRYNSSADTNLNADIIKIQKIINNEEPMQDAVTLNPKAIVENGRFTLSSAFVTGILCLMASVSPQSFAVGRTINITNDSVSNTAKKQYHHFFPQKSEVIINNSEYKRDVNNVVNIVFMDARTNEQISNRNPSDYISQFYSENPDFDLILHTHFVSLDNFGIENDDYFAFINARSEAMFVKLKELVIPSKHDTINSDLFY